MKPILAYWTRCTVAILLSFWLAAPASAALFTDVGTGNWAQSAIETLSQSGIIAGYPNGSFRPEGLITRAEFAAMLTRAEGWNQTSSGATFRDVPPSNWAYNAIESAASRGVISGYPGGYFRPSQNISRAEAMSMMVHAAQLPLPTTAEAEQTLTRFTDADQVPNWARPSVAAAISAKIFANEPTRNNLIDPNSPATRAEVAMMTENLLNVAVTPTTPIAPISQAVTEMPSTVYAHVAIIPANTQFTAIAATNFGSSISTMGDQVTMVLDQPLMDGQGETVAPAGSQLIGQVNYVDKPSMLGDNGGIGVNFTQLVTPDGRAYPISATFGSDTAINTNGEGQITASTRWHRIGEAALRVIGGGALGAGLGAALGGIEGNGKADDYLVRGAVIGGGVGAGSAIFNRGNDIQVLTGERLPIRLRAPLTVSVNSTQP